MNRNALSTLLAFAAAGLGPAMISSSGINGGVKRYYTRCHVCGNPCKTTTCHKCEVRQRDDAENRNHAEGK